MGFILLDLYVIYRDFLICKDALDEYDRNHGGIIGH
jgi:hypothetical protein